MRIYSLVVLLIMPGFILRDGGCGPNDVPLTKESLLRINARNSVYQGESPYNLSSEAIRVRGGWRDTLLVGDDPESRHGEIMKEMLISMGIPEESLSFPSLLWWASSGDGNVGLREFVSGRHESLRRNTQVVHVPFNIPFKSEKDAERMRGESGILFITATSNSEIYRGIDRINSPTSRPWDLWNDDHLFWQAGGAYGENSGAEENWKLYQDILEIARLGNVIFASSAGISSDSTTVEPWRRVIRCGTLKNACFTIIPEQYTSDASARLAAMAFYLFQFPEWNTPQKVVDALKECAIDAGEPGPDVEYGLGIANLICGPVLQKEMDAVFAQNPSPAARSMRNVVNALGDHPKFTEFAVAMFSAQ